MDELTTFKLALAELDPASMITVSTDNWTHNIPVSQLDAALNVGYAPKPVPVSVVYQAKVNVAGLYVRTAPGVNSPIVADLAYGDVVDVFSDPPILSVSGYDWLHVRHGALIGWSARRYLDKVLTGEPPPVAPPLPASKTKHRIGLHVLSDGVAAAETFINAAHPPSVTVIDSIDFANKAVALGVPFVIYRSVQTANGDDVHVPEDDPVLSWNAGLKVVAERWPRFEALDPHVFIQITNEQSWNPGHNSFWLGVMTALEARGRHAAIGCYGVGQPETAQWSQLAEALTHAKQHGHIVVLHAYGAPDAQPGQLSPLAEQTYFEERAPRLYNSVPAEARPPLVIAEYGGEFSRGKFQGTENLIHLVQQYEAANAQFAELVSVNLWTAGHNGDGTGNWKDACIDSALPDLAAWLNQ